MTDKNTFLQIFGRSPQFSARACGRVNLIGEHTDYNGGFVLPTAIPQTTRVEIAVRQDGVVRVSSVFNGEMRSSEYRLGEESLKKTWTDYLQGITKLLKERFPNIRGFDARIESEVPMGSGLSSSAAFEVSVTRAISKAFSLGMDDVAIAKFSQSVENEFVGARVGIMDPMAASICDLGTALFLDTRDLTFRQIPLPAEAELIVINSGVSHSNVGGDYNARRGECEKACALLKIHQLRDLTVQNLDRLDALPDLLKRRARHVITENERVVQSVQAMEQNDLQTLGRLFNESHASMRDDYEVSIPEIDLLVDLAVKNLDIYGARLTGGGFGGSIVALARKNRGGSAAKNIADNYTRMSGQKAVVLVPAHQT